MIYVVPRTLFSQIASLLKENSRLCAIFLISTLFYIVFKRNIEVFFIEYIKKYLIIIPTWYSSFSILCVFLISLGYAINQFHCKDLKISIKSLAGFFLLLAIYFYYKLYFIPNSDFILVPLFGQRFITYSDVWIPLFFLFQTYIFKEGTLDYLGDKDCFIEDKPTGVEDLFNRTNLAKALVNKINITYPRRSFAIGIVAKWGKGKTVFKDILKSALDPSGENLESKNNIIIEFNPWRSVSATQVITDFFLELETSLAPYDPRLSNLLQNYLESLNKVSETVITKATKELLTLLIGDEALRSKYERINEVIKKLNRRIIIFIDDMDRLDSDEIKEVLRLIRNTADFTGTFFIVSYDYQYVNKALTAGNNVSYLDKVFQLEIPLPTFQENVLFLKLMELINGDENIFIERAVISLSRHKVEMESAGIYLDNFFDSYFKSVRDIIRYSNSFNLLYNSKGGEIEELDFILLEMLRLKFPQVYEYLSDSSNIRFSLRNSNGSVTYESTEIVKRIHQFGLINDNEKNLVQRTLSALLGADNTSNNFRSLKNPDNHFIYFSFDLVGRISIAEFNQVRVVENIDDFFEWLDTKITSHRNDLITVLQSTNQFSSKVHFERMIEGLFYLTKYVNDNWAPTIHLKIYQINEILSLYYGGYAGLENYKKFLRNLLLNDSYNDLARSNVAASLLEQVMAQGFNQEGFSQEYLRDILLTLLEIKLKSFDFTDPSVEPFILNNFVRQYSSSETIEITDSAIVLIVNQFAQDPHHHIHNLIQKVDNSETDLYKLHPLFQRIYRKKTEDFYSLIDSFCDQKKYDKRTVLSSMRFKEFYRKAANNDFQPIIYDPNTIEYVSDSRTEFKKSSSFPSINVSKRCEENLDHVYMRLIHQGNQAFYGCLMISDRAVITRIEEINGGLYKLVRKIDLTNLTQSEVNGAFIELFVDDDCDLIINDILIESKIHTAHGPGGWTLQTVYKREIGGLLNYGEINEIKFDIRNAPMPDVESRHPDVPTGSANPYGVVFRVVILLNDKVMQ